MESKFNQQNVNIYIFSKNRSAHRTFFISAIFGIFPFWLEDDRFRFSVAYAVFSSVVFLFVCQNVYQRTYYVLLTGFDGDDALDNAVNLWMHNSFAVMMFFSVMDSFRRVNKINDILSELNDIDRLLGSANFWKDRLHSRCTISSFGIVTMLLLLVYSPWGIDYFMISLKIILLLLCGSLLLTSAQFSTLAYLIHDKISEACDSLQDLRHLAPFSLRSQKMMELSIIHNRICNVCSSLEVAYSSIVTIIITVCFFAITIFSYQIIGIWPDYLMKNLELLIPSTNFEDAFAVLKVVYLIVPLYCSWQITASASIICKKIIDFNTILYKMMSTDRSKKIFYNDQLRLHIAMKREVVFTAGGFICVDFMLIHTMVASAATYLVMLVQFGSSKK